jgi:hypothetical protein
MLKLQIKFFSHASQTPIPCNSPLLPIQNLSFILEATVLKFPYTFPGGLPRIKLTIASLAICIFLKPPRIWILESASTYRQVSTFIQERPQEPGSQDMVQELGS